MGRALLAALAALAIAVAAGAEPQSPVQQRCVLEVNKRAAGVAKAASKRGVWCHKAKSTAKLVGPTWSQCVDSDLADGKTARAAAKVWTGRTKKCDDAELPTLAFTALDESAADALSQAALDQTRKLGEDVLRLPAVVVLKDRDPASAKCQAEVVKRTFKLYDLRIKEANEAKKAALALGAGSDAEIGAAITGAWDGSTKGASATLKLLARAEKKCEELAPTFIFQGVCAGATIADVATCAAERTRCRACLMLEAVDGLALDCDAMDDATVNLSCP